MENFVKTWDNSLAEENCKEIIDWFENRESEYVDDPIKQMNEPLRDSRGHYGASNRKDICHFLMIDANAKNLQNMILGCINSHVQEYVLDYPALQSYRLYNNEIKVQRTNPHGGYHIWHHEHGSSDLNSAHRILVWTLYLNDLPEGEGETEFLFQGEKVQPKTGRVCIFPAAFTHYHRGNPPYSCDKYIATGWIIADYEK